MTRSCGERANAGTRRRNGAGSFFGENGNGEQTEGHMIENPYKRLPPLERKPDGTPYGTAEYAAVRCSAFALR